MEVVNAPSMIDVRPFYFRAPDALWSASIGYTVLAPRAPVRGPAPDMVEPAGLPLPAKVLTAANVRTYADKRGIVTWGIDLQNRGYLLYYEGDVIKLVAALLAQHESSDLGKPEPWMWALDGKLRTTYTMTHVR